MRTWKLSLALLALVPVARPLLVAPGSPCAVLCGNVLTGDSPADMTCQEAQYSSSQGGPVFEQCINCQLTSGYTNGNDSDLGALLYNLRYAASYCLWGAGLTGTSPCTTSFACGPLQPNVQWNNMSTNVGNFDYCDGWYQLAANRCEACLRPSPFGNYFANMFVVLDTACAQLPAAGSTVSIQGSVFSDNTVNETTPIATLAAPLPSYGPVNLGARVGIAFGSLALILAVAGFCIVMNGKRRRRAFLRELEKRHGPNGYPNPKAPYGYANSHNNNGSAVMGMVGNTAGGTHGMSDTPLSQRPLRGWDDSPISAHTEASLPRYMSPYSSQYNSPTNGLPGGPWSSSAQEKMFMQASIEHQRRQQQQQQMDMMPPIGVALGGDDASLRSRPSNPDLLSGDSPSRKGKVLYEEAYEMVESPYSGGGSSSNMDHYRLPVDQQPPPPTLSHPGYGRQQRPS